MTASAFSVLTNGRISPDLLGQIADEVALVEDELRQQVGSQVDLVQRVGRHTLNAGGKRLRPAFVTLAAKASGLPFDHARARKLGACMEMIHMATLIHDDVIDDAGTRRGIPTASMEFGNTAAILSGDVLLAKAMVLLAQDGDLRIIRIVSEAVVEIAEGEVRELEVRGDFDLEEAGHLAILRMKTASFIRACCEVGGLLAGCSDTVCDALREYGDQVGMAFQIADDLLDYRGDRSKTGKPLATDFREGQATLPLIYLREQLSEPEYALARHRFGNSVADEEIRVVVDWMATRGAFARCETAASRHIGKALAALESLPDTSARNFLQSAAEYVLDRQG